jgi:hypothetical protein
MEVISSVWRYQPFASRWTVPHNLTDALRSKRHTLLYNHTMGLTVQPIAAEEVLY